MVPTNRHGAPRLGSLVVRYVRRRRARGELTAATAEQYTSRLLSFARSIDVEPAKVTRRHVERWLARPGLSPHYRRALLSAVRGFCQWCVLEGHMHRDPTLGIPMTKLPPLLPRAVATEEAEELVTTAIANRDPRVRLCCVLMLQLGLRRGEVARIQLGDIDRRKLTIGVRGKGGQGGVTRRLPLTEEAWRAIVAYLPTVQASSGPLLRSTRNPSVGISPSWVGELVARAMLEAGVKQYSGDGRSAHALRHTCAQDLVDLGVDIRVVQRVLGHASIRNTEIYTQGAVRGLREAMEGRRYERPQAGPLADAG